MKWYNILLIVISVIILLMMTILGNILILLMGDFILIFLITFLILQTDNNKKLNELLEKQHQVIVEQNRQSFESKDVRKEVSIEIFDRLYMGDTNMIIIGETPCLQSLSNGGIDILKHKTLKHFLENFMKKFYELAYEYTDGERGTKQQNVQHFGSRKSEGFPINNDGQTNNRVEIEKSYKGF